MAAGIVRARSDWRAAVLVCGRCSRKLDGGFGKHGDRSLAKALRKHAGLGKGRRAAIGIVETACLTLCPKRAVAVIDGAEPGTWLVVRAGTPIGEVAAALPSLQALAPA